MDIRESVRKAVFGDRWRSWLGVVGFGSAGAVFVGLSASESHWNQDIWAAFVMGVISLLFCGVFAVRVMRLPAYAARIGDLLATQPREVAWIYEQVIAMRAGQRVWNVFVWTTGGEKMRIAVYRQHVRDDLWTALQESAPHAIAPYSKERERVLKSAMAA